MKLNNLNVNMERKYPKGIWFNQPHPNAPDFVIGKISIKRQDFLEWLDKQNVNEKGYIYLDVKESREGEPYCEVNDFKFKKRENQNKPPVSNMPEEKVDPKGVPF